MRNSVKQPEQKGAILSLVIIFAILFTGLLMGILLRSAQLNGRFNAQSQAEMQARYAAHGAIERAYGKLSEDPEWRDGFPTRTPMPQNPKVSYRLKVKTSVPFAVLGPGELGFIAQGYSDEGEPGKVLAAMGGTAFRPPAGFQEAAFVDGELTLEDTETSAYDSRDSAATDIKGGVGGNGTVTLGSGGNVDGDVTVCDPATDEGLVENGGSYTGELVQEAKKRALPTYISTLSAGSTDLTEANFESLLADTEYEALQVETDGVDPVLAPGAYRELSIKDRTLKLSGGDYYFSDQVSLENVTLIVQADTKLVVGRSMNLVNSNLNNVTDADGVLTSLPTDLTILFSDEIALDPGEPGKSVFQGEASVINGVVAGRGLEADLSGVTVRGALQANNAKLRGSSNLIFDKATEELELSSYTVWRLRNIVVLPRNTPF
jgi:hypothetical protein